MSKKHTTGKFRRANRPACISGQMKHGQRVEAHKDALHTSSPDSGRSPRRLPVSRDRDSWRDKRPWRYGLRRESS